MSSDVYRSLLNELDDGKKAAVVTIMNNGNIGGESAYRKITLTEDQLSTHDNIHHLDETIVNKARFAIKTGNLQYFEAPDGASILIEPYFPSPRLIVLGGGHIAKPLVEFGSKVGFLVTVVDDRPMFACKDRFPDAEKVICESFDNCFDQLDINEYSFVVIVTRGHRHDMDCMRKVLNYKTAYTGMIGSKRRVKIFKEQLINEGYTDEMINKVNAPIGLDIGAITPEEIAISIIAQVISYRRLVRSSTDDTALGKVYWPEFDRPVLEELCKASDGHKALITIISTNGSVPRKAGAKMLVWQYGKTLGSVGGGCAEGEVINSAWDIIRSGGFKTYDIDLTGQIAEEEGMVCGGVMRVLIEDYNG